MIYHSNIKEIASLLLKKDLQNALNNLFFEVQEKFHSSKKANNICADREKVAEKHIGELSSTSAQNETNNIKITEHIREVIQEIKLELNTKMIQRKLEKEYKSYKRKTKLNSIDLHLSLKENDVKTIEYKVQQTLCKDFSRPFLKIKTSKKKYESNQKKIMTDSVFSNISFTQIKRSSFSVEEEEDDTVDEIRSKLTEESVKNKGNFSAIAGIISLLAIKYGYIQIKYNKKHPKLCFRYDESVHEKYHTEIELFRFNPGDCKIYAKTWKLNKLINVFPKSYLMKQTAVELLFSDGKNILLNFTNSNDRIDFLLEVKKIQKNLPNLKIRKPKTLIKSMPTSAYKAKIFVDPSMTEK